MGIKREGFEFKLPDPNSENFFQEFADTQRKIKRTQKFIIPLAITGGILGLVFVVTLIWAIITVVSRYKGG